MVVAAVSTHMDMSVIPMSSRHLLNLTQNVASMVLIHPPLTTSTKTVYPVLGSP